MSVTQQSTVTTHTATGSTAVFAYGFRVLAAADLVVEVNGAPLTLGVDYTVSGVGLKDGGTVTLTGGAPAAGVVVRLRRSTRLVRSTDYQSGGDFLAAVVNSDFDRAIMALQDLFYGSSGPGNSLRAPAGEALGELPAAPQRAGMQLLFDAQGAPYLAAPVSGSAADVLLQLASTASGKGAAQVGAKRALPGAAARTLDEVNNARTVNVVLDYLASPANTRAQNDAAFYAALNSGAKTVFVPASYPGKYLLSARISILAAALGVTLIGEDKVNTILSWHIDASTADKFGLLLDANVRILRLTLENTGDDATNSGAIVSSSPTDANGCHDSEFDVRVIGNWGAGVGATVDGNALSLVRSQFFSNRGAFEFDGVTIPISLGAGCNDNELICKFWNNKGTRHIKLIEGANNRIFGTFEPVHASVTTGMLNAELIRCPGTYIRGYMEPCYGFLADSSPGTIIEPTCEGFDWAVGNLTNSAILRSTNASNGGVFAAPMVSHVRLPVCRASSNPTSYAASDDNTSTLTLVDAITSRDANFKARPAGQSGGYALSYRGTWSPIIRGEGGTFAHTYSQQLGWYIRSGQLVTCFFRAALSARDAGMTGNALLAGLPFPPVADTLYVAAATLSEYQADLSAGYTQLGGDMSAGEQFIRLVQSGDNVSPLALPASGITATSAFLGSISYITEAP